MNIDYLKYKTKHVCYNFFHYWKYKFCDISISTEIKQTLNSFTEKLL